MVINCKKLTDTAKTPEFQSAGAAGADLYADLTESIKLYPGQRVLIGTGISLAIPEGYEGQVCSRSGLANKFGVCVLNAPGIIDADFRHELKVLLINNGCQNKDILEIRPGDRIAQLVVVKVEKPTYETVTTMDTTERAGGWGSTGGFATKEAPMPKLQ